MNHTPKTFTAEILTLVLLGVALAGCGERKSELERYEKLTKELMEKRGIDLNRKVVIGEGDTFADEGELRALCDKFMKHFGAGEIDLAFDLLDGHSPWPADEMKKLREQTRSQIEMVRPRYGKPVGYEFIKSEIAGSSVAKYLYLAKLENHPLRCTFLFYKPADKWTLNMFVWDDKIPLL